MSKPSEEELDTALKMAAQMRDKDSDPFFIAKSLLSHNYRMKYLEELMQAADRYINHGMAWQIRKKHVYSAPSKKSKMQNLLPRTANATVLAWSKNLKLYFISEKKRLRSSAL